MLLRGQTLLNNIYGKAMESFWVKVIYFVSTVVGFLIAYFTDLAIDNANQYMAVLSVIMLDGFFGLIAGVKREGFLTRKALKIVRTLVTWTIILTVILSIELGLEGIDWLSDTIIFPFVVVQLISALKNASVAGFIKTTWMNKFLENIDEHKNHFQDKD